MGFIKEFKEFAMKGNVMDMAVGVIIGGAFGKIVGTLVIVLAVLLADEVVHVHKELRCCTCTREHRTNHKHHVDESAGE